MTPLIIGGLILIALVAYFAQQSSSHEYWRVTYETEGKNPYDIKILYRLLQERFEVTELEERVDKVLPTDERAEKTTYLYLGKEPKYTEEEAWHLREYVKAGGEAFLITGSIQDSLAELLFYPEDCGSETTWTGTEVFGTYSSTVWSRVEHPSVRKNYYSFTHAKGNYIDDHYWQYIPDEVFCDSYGDDPYADYETPMRQYAIARLGSFRHSPKAGEEVGLEKEELKKHYTNFVRLKVGEGYFYFHTNPLMFTNLYLVDTAGFEYANLVFSHFGDKDLYWDRESLLPRISAGNARRFNPTVAAQSPLEYIFSQPALSYSWYLALILGAIYILFGAKRRQRVIPIMETNHNTSLEFIETIGRLYFQQQDHKSIIKKQMHLFLAHVRQRYHLVTRDLNSQLVNRISVRARVDHAIVNDIFKEYFRLRKLMQNPHAPVSAEMLNNFYLLIERFHKATRKPESAPITKNN